MDNFLNMRPNEQAGSLESPALPLSVAGEEKTPPKGRGNEPHTETHNKQFIGAEGIIYMVPAAFSGADFWVRNSANLCSKNLIMSLEKKRCICRCSKPALILRFILARDLADITLPPFLPALARCAANHRGASRGGIPHHRLHARFVRSVLVVLALPTLTIAARWAALRLKSSPASICHQRSLRQPQQQTLSSTSRKCIDMLVIVRQCLRKSKALSNTSLMRLN